MLVMEEDIKKSLVTCLKPIILIGSCCSSLLLHVMIIFWCDHFMSYRTKTLVSALAPNENIGASASSNGIVYFTKFCTDAYTCKDLIFSLSSFFCLSEKLQWSGMVFHAITAWLLFLLILKVMRHYSLCYCMV